MPYAVGHNVYGSMPENSRAVEITEEVATRLRSIVPYYVEVGATIFQGKCEEVIPNLAAESIDAIVTDPPYALGFMGKAWDSDLPTVETWAECLRVARPGAHLLAFGGTRTYHRLACAIEDAGWEIRDCLSWLYGSGFPKSHNGEWGGTALKPAWEPVVLARKPLVGTVAANHAAHRTGGLNIDGCRIFTSPDDAAAMERCNTPGSARNVSVPSEDGRFGRPSISGPMDTSKGRWPANVALDEEAARLLDEQSGERPGDSPDRTIRVKRPDGFGYSGPASQPWSTPGHSDSGGASRFFYTAKASRGEREDGLTNARGQRDETRDPTKPGGNNPRNRGVSMVRNTHPTVKPLDLMRWLVRLVCPSGGIVLDPFLGSGTTALACREEGVSCIGIEREEEYCAIAKGRMSQGVMPFRAAT